MVIIINILLTIVNTTKLKLNIVKMKKRMYDATSFSLHDSSYYIGEINV